MSNTEPTNTEIENINLTGLNLADLIGNANQNRADLKVQEANNQYSTSLKHYFFSKKATSHPLQPHQAWMIYQKFVMI